MTTFRTGFFREISQFSNKLKAHRLNKLRRVGNKNSLKHKAQREQPKATLKTEEQEQPRQLRPLLRHLTQDHHPLSLQGLHKCLVHLLKMQEFPSHLALLLNLQDLWHRWDLLHRQVQASLFNLWPEVQITHLLSIFNKIVKYPVFFLIWKLFKYLFSFQTFFKPRSDKKVLSCSTDWLTVSTLFLDWHKSNFTINLW